MGAASSIQQPSHKAAAAAPLGGEVAPTRLTVHAKVGIVIAVLAFGNLAIWGAKAMLS